jgi:thiamine-phosphate pyrophosphorylase
MKAAGRVDFDVYLITDSNATRGRALLGLVRLALEGGIRAVQLRGKHLSGRALFDLALKMRRLTDEFSAKLFINDRLDVALASNADGVHLGATGFSPSDVKGHLKKGMLVGVSTHTQGEVLKARQDGADFITFGPVYYTESKAKYGEPVGVERLREAVMAANMPVFAIGGMGPERAAEVMRAGAKGVAIISSVLSADDVKRAAMALKEKLQ